MLNPKQQDKLDTENSKQELSASQRSLYNYLLLRGGGGGWYFSKYHLGGLKRALNVRTC